MRIKILSAAVVSLLAMAACNKSISDRTANLQPLDPADQDINAGTWKPMLLTRPDTFAVAAPAATNSTGYAADLNELKGFQKNMTDAQLGAMKYWSAGGVLRWNEIMRGLVAKYNIPPYQNSDTSYPAPNANNPFAYPYFPFANPPYAARAYAYVSAAQYDALVACWYYKNLYKRPAPYKTDSTIKVYVTKTDLPSYPSEAAVLAGVTAEMMKLLFPDEIATIQLKLQEQENAAILSGAATRSDITAGELLGRQVAQLFTARGRTDNAGKAGGTPADWAHLVDVAESKDQTPWLSLETPHRPPMLPLFGKVKCFLFDSATLVSLRPGPPPSTSSDSMKNAVSEVYGKITNPTRDQMKLVQYWADGAGTFTPPGHWNAIASEDFIKKNYSEVRWARNLALLNCAEMDAAVSCWDIKYFYFNPRPSQMNGDIKTLTGVPNFPSYVSGHSMFSGAAAVILGHIVPERASAYMQMAQDATNSRFVGGIHYKVDCTVGMTVGKNIGNYAVLRATQDGAE
jgi:hypothetical protein